MIYIMGTWRHVRELTKRLGIHRRDFEHLSRPEKLALAGQRPNVVVLVTAYESRDIHALFKAINEYGAVTWGEQDLIDGKVPR